MEQSRPAHGSEWSPWKPIDNINIRVTFSPSASHSHDISHQQHLTRHAVKMTLLQSETVCVSAGVCILTITWLGLLWPHGQTVLLSFACILLRMVSNIFSVHLSSTSPYMYVCNLASITESALLGLSSHLVLLCLILPPQQTAA